jgi:hypothetical protein
METQPHTKLEWRRAAVVYWYHLLPLPLFSGFAFYAWTRTHGALWVAIVIVPAFFGTAIFASLPYLRGHAGRSYMRLAGLLYVFGGIGLCLLCELLLRSR